MYMYIHIAVAESCLGSKMYVLVTYALYTAIPAGRLYFELNFHKSAVILSINWSVSDDNYKRYTLYYYMYFGKKKPILNVCF